MLPLDRPAWLPGREAGGNSVNLPPKERKRPTAPVSVNITDKATNGSSTHGVPVDVE
jgi:hypothetical protein